MSATAWTPPGTITSVARQTGDIAWTDPTNAASDNGVYAIANDLNNTNGLLTEILKCVNFDFSSIPAGARIDGIEMRYQCRAEAGSAGVFIEKNILLYIDGNVTGIDKVVPNNWSNADQLFTHGGATDTWGIPLNMPEGLTAVQTSTFGFGIRAARPASATARDAWIDYVEARIHYTEAASVAWDAACDAAVCFASRPEATTLGLRFALPGMGVADLLFFMAANTTGLGVKSSGTLDYSIGQALSTTNTAWIKNNQLATGASVRACDNDNPVVIKMAGTTMRLVEKGDGYVDVDFTAIVGTNRQPIACIAFKGTGVDFEQAMLPGINGDTTDDITDFTAEPDLVLITSGQEVYDGGEHQHWVGQDIGFLLNNGAGGFTQWNTYWVSRKESTIEGAGEALNAEPYAHLSTGHFHDQRDFNNNDRFIWGASAADANGWTTTQTTSGTGDGNGTDDDGAIALAMVFSGDITGAAWTLTVSTSTGTIAYDSGDFSPAFTHTPRFWFAVATKVDTEDVDEDDTEKAEVCAFLFVTRHQSACLSIGQDRGQSWSTNYNLLDKVINIDNGDGTALVDATLTSFDAGGVTFGVTTAPAAAYKWHGMSIGEEPGAPAELPPGSLYDMRF